MDDDTLVALEMALQNHTPNLTLPSGSRVDMKAMATVDGDRLHRRQAPNLDDTWYVFSDSLDPEGADIQLDDDTSDLLSLAHDAGYSEMTYYNGYQPYVVNFATMRVGPPGLVVGDKLILRVQKPLDSADSDDTDALRCPITQMPIVEQVVAPDGHTSCNV